MKIKETKWSFLQSIKKTKSPLPRSLLLQRCLHDLTLIDFILSECKKRLKLCGKDEKMYVSFSLSLLIEIASASQINDGFLLRVFPFILKGLKSSNANYYASSLMAVSHFTTRTQFEQNVVQSLLTRISRHPVQELSLSSLLCFATVCNTQSPPTINATAISNLLKYPNINENLKQILAKFPLPNFIISLSRSFLRLSITQQKPQKDKIIISFFKSLSKEHLQAIVCDVCRFSLRFYYENHRENSAEIPCTTLDVLRMFHIRCPEDVDTALNAELSEANKVSLLSYFFISTSLLLSLLLTSFSSFTSFPYFLFSSSFPPFPFALFLN
jgi:U3 small nucleolar RNA-associated protein 10